MRLVTERRDTNDKKPVEYKAVYNEKNPWWWGGSLANLNCRSTDAPVDDDANQLPSLALDYRQILIGLIGTKKKKKFTFKFARQVYDQRHKLRRVIP